MGRQNSEKRKRSTVSAIDERERVKESILKVFRARLKSPSQGGALLVGQEKQKEKNNESTPEDTMSGRSRGKRKSSRQKKTSKNKSAPIVQPETAVTKHMKIAHGIVYSHGKEKEESGVVNRIAPSRLTQKVGIFSAGKKSRPATRGLFVPEHIQQQTEADIKKIIQTIDCSISSSDTGSLSDSHTTSRRRDSSISKGVDTAPMSIDDDKTPTVKSNSTIVSSETVTSSNSSECTSEELGLEPLNLRKTTNELMVPLGSLVKRLFPRRDCLKETLSVLHKLIKQNGPRSATPTPIPILNKISASGGLQRALFGASPWQQSVDQVRSQVLNEPTSCNNTNIDDGPSRVPFASLVSSKPVVNFPKTNSHQTNHIQTEPMSTQNYSKTKQHHSESNHTRELNYSKNDHLQTEPSYKRSLSYNKTNPLQTEPNYRILHYSKTNELQTELSYKSTQSLNGNRKGEHDIHYYRSRLLGTDVRDGVFAGKNKDSNTFLSRMSNNHAKHSNSSLHRDVNTLTNYKENNETDYGKHTDRLFETKNDKCMVPKDDFSAFFKGEENICSYAVEQNHVTKRPLEDSCVKMTKPISPLLDHEALVMLHVNDSRSIQSRQQLEPMECETRLEDAALNLLEKNDRMQTLNEDRRSQENECFCKDARSNSQNLTGSTTHTSQEKVMYMPSFHSDYYKDHLTVKDLLWQKSNLPFKAESMDLLDHVDMDSRMEVQHEVRDILQVATLNTERIPAWRPVDSLPDLKTTQPKFFRCNSTDSPQLVLSPRKMY